MSPRLDTARSGGRVVLGFVLACGLAGCAASSPTGGSPEGEPGNAASPGGLSRAPATSAADATGQRIPPALGAFYTQLKEPPATAAPGTVVQSEAVEPSVFAASTTTRLAYVVAGSPPALETGLLVLPTNAAPRGLVVVGHQTVGTADACAPSANPSALRPMQPYLQTILDTGFALAIPDYAGLGGPGPHPYLVASAAAESILGIIGPARTLASIAPDTPAALIGFSQGGQAVLAAGARQSFAAVAAISPITDLFGIFQRSDAFPPAGLLASLVGHQQGTPGLRLRDALTPAGLGATQRLASTCDLASLHLGPWDTLVVAQALQSDLWAAALRADSLTAAQPLSPTLLVRGNDDPVFSGGDQDALAATWCSEPAGKSATLLTLELAAADHGDTNRTGGPQATAWLLGYLGVSSNEAPLTRPLC